MKLKLLGPSLAQASFKSLERVLEMFYMMGLFGDFFVKFAKEEYFNHDQLRPVSLSILTSSSHTSSKVRSYWYLRDLAKSELNLGYI